jgi:hypothetical protein
VPDQIAYRHLFRYVGKLKKEAEELEGKGKTRQAIAHTSNARQTSANITHAHWTILPRNTYPKCKWLTLVHGK